ncbi:MAG: SH3 domain-containing protein [Clostridiales bacterium]|nr:SH3 domain-containing protein [Clostridiales bacterium]
MKLRNLIYAIAVLLLVSVAVLGAKTASASTMQYGTVTGNDANLRFNPDLDSEVLAKMPINARVCVLEYKDNWYKVVYSTESEDITGYVRSDLLFVNTDGTRTAYVTEDDVKLRGGAGTSSYIIAKLKVGQPVKIKAMISGWYLCVAGDSIGFVHRDYLSVSRPGSTTLERLLMPGMSGIEVERLQNALYDRGFLSVVDITSYYGAKTRSAVAAFQSACGLMSDGIAGDVTISSLYDEANGVTSENAMFNKVKGSVELLDWFKGGSTWLKKGAYFTIIDVKTGMSFQARRFGGWYHADSEPVTAQDTVIMKAISNGAWSWDRRAIWVNYNGRTVAGSMHTMPHMVNPTQSNNFDGHFCVHLLNSKVHETSRACPRHQYCVKQAYEAGKAD